MREYQKKRRSKKPYVEDYSGASSQPASLKSGRYEGITSQVKSILKFRHKTSDQLKQFWQRHCKRCDEIKPARTHHCMMCDKCVFAMDHHCPWVNNCIGRRNYRYFFMFLISLTLHMIGIFVLCLIHVLHHKEQLTEVRFYLWLLKEKCPKTLSEFLKIFKSVCTKLPGFDNFH